MTLAQYSITYKALEEKLPSCSNHVVCLKNCLYERTNNLKDATSIKCYRLWLYKKKDVLFPIISQGMESK